MGPRIAPAEGEGEGLQGAAEPAPQVAAVKALFEPLFAGTGGIDSWLGDETPKEVFNRLARCRTTH